MIAQQSDKTLGQLKKLLALPPLNGTDDKDPLSATHETGNPLVDADIICGRVETTLMAIRDEMNEDNVQDSRDFDKAMNIVLNQAAVTTRRHERDPFAELTPEDAEVYEAIVRADGTRPSLLVREGAVDPKHPMAGDWSGDLEASQDTLRPLINAIGRVEPAGATADSFFGTAWMVDSDELLAMTNLHVVEAMWSNLPHLVERTRGGFRIRGGIFVDFIGEAANLKSNRFKVIEAITPRLPDGDRFERLDIALLRLEAVSAGAQSVPEEIPISIDPSGADGFGGSFCIVGFPGPPRYRSGTHLGVDWAWVNKALFGHRYGVKRLAPGEVHKRLGAVEGDEKNNWIFGHDATTLGGNSGSPVIRWTEDEPSSFGIHFAGATMDSNYAHAFAQCVKALEDMGLDKSKMKQPV